jgi:tetratricopeptide (TPR) repeat protein
MKPPFEHRPSETYDAFLAIDTIAYKDKIAFIEENFFKLRELDADEYFDMMVLYGEALFETGEYARQAKLADHIVEMSIERNIVHHRGQDVYAETLFRKAASLHNLDRLDEAVYILKELVKINPANESYKLFLINCVIRQKKPAVRPYRTTSLVLLLSSVVVIAAELTLVRVFWPKWIDVVEPLRNGLFLAGVLLLVAGEVIVRYRAVEDVFSFTRETKKKKEETGV